MSNIKKFCLNLAIILKFSFIILSAFLGVGFASGAEISIFFVNFNILSIHFAFFSCVIFNFLIYFTLTNKSLNKMNDISILQSLIFLIISSAMISGVTELVKIFYSHPQFITLAVLVFLFLILSKSFNFWSSFSFVCCCLMLIGISIIIFNSPTKELSKPFINFKITLMPLLYLNFNFLTIFPVASQIGLYVSKKKSLAISILTSSIIFILIVSILSKISNPTAEMPMLSLAKNGSKIQYYFYIFILFLSSITTAISCLTGLTNQSRFLIKNKKANTICCLCVCYFLSSFGFNTIINFLYPLLGAMGFIFLIRCIKKRS